MDVGMICKRDVETMRAGATVTDAARRMAERHVGAILVVDERSRPMGIVTDRDITTRVVAHGRDAQRTGLADVMTPMPVTVLESASIESALSEMRVGHLRRLPVVNGMDEVVGILAMDDIVRVLAVEIAEIGNLIEAESPVRGQ
jgi:CBS domain-containing protein